MPEVVKINCDGAIFKEQKKSGIGAVLSNALRNNSTYLSSFGLLIEDIKCNASFFNQSLYSHIKRESNMVAHNLARHSISISDFLVWMEIVLPPFVSLVLADIAGFS
ncbi:hypothetical protein ACB092_11G202400 [Castanea dentata]